MTSRVYLLQPAEEAIRWQTIFSRLGETPCNIRDRKSQTSLKRQPPQGLLVADRQLLHHEVSASSPCILQWIDHKGAIVVTGPRSSDTFDFPVEEMDGEIDLHVINQLLLKHLPSYSRRVPRVTTRLPGIYTTGKNHHLCEIANLSLGGAFVRTGTLPPSIGSDIRIHIALLGLRKEVELDGQIVRQTVPQEQNNYQQGFGVQFSQESDFPSGLLQDYVKNAVCSLIPAQPAYRGPAADSLLDDEENEIPPLPPAAKRSTSRGGGQTIRHLR